jgi:aspartate-semialdehyde dehydrogenase
MAVAGQRIAVVGATGALGSELIEALSASSIRVAEIRPVATDDSHGADVEFQDEIFPVETELPSLHGLDFVFLCAPPAVSLVAAREALRAEVPAIDLSGALATSPEVPLRVATLGGAAGGAASPMIATPTGPALALAIALRPIAEQAGLVGVQATVLDSASAGGVHGTESLMSESIALFNQQDIADPTVFSRPIAFDCGPGVTYRGATDDLDRDALTAAMLARLIGDEVEVSLTSILVPTFLGLGCTLHISTREALTADAAAALLAKADGVEVWSDGVEGPSLRAAAGRDDVLVSRILPDPSRHNGLRLWLATDPVCLAAANAVRLAEARLAGVPGGFARGGA